MKRISPFFLLIIISLILSSHFILNSNAVNYQWIVDGGFEIGSSTAQSVSNGGFEDGIVSPWYCTADPTKISVTHATNYYHSGYWGLQILYPRFASINMTGIFGENVTVTDITDFNFWTRKTASSGNGVTITLWFTEGTGTNNSGKVVYQWNFANIWYYKDLLNTIQTDFPTKTIYQIDFAGWNTNGYLDDFVFGIGGFTPESAYVNLDTTPWFIPYGGEAIIDDMFANSGSNSIHGTLSVSPSTFWDLEFNFPIIVQKIGQLNSSTISNFTLYGYNSGDDSSCGIRAYGWFLDGLIASQYQSFTDNETWQFFNFTSMISQYADNNRILVAVGFVQEGTNDYVYIDDVSLLSIVQKVTSNDIFTYSLSPEPILYVTGIVNDGFHAFAGVSYTFRGYLSTIDNGTFFVVATSTFSGTSVSGTVTNNYFTFAISPRIYHYTSDYEEKFVITVSNDDNEFTVTLIATWITPASTTPATTPAITTTMQTNFIVYFPVLIVFALFTIPATYWLGMAGFLGGIDLSFLFCTWFGLLPSWGIAVLVLINVALIYFKVDSSRNHKDSEEP